MPTIKVFNPDWNDENPEYLDQYLDLKAKYVVCDSCEGEGRSSGYLGAFTSDEWNELDPEWREDYKNGAFDRACSTCDGNRVILEVDRDNNSAELLAIYDREQEEKWIDEQTHRMEMRMYGDM